MLYAHCCLIRLKAFYSTYAQSTAGTKIKKNSRQAKKIIIYIFYIANFPTFSLYRTGSNVRVLLPCKESAVNKCSPTVKFKGNTKRSGDTKKDNKKNMIFFLNRWKFT